MKPAFFTNMTSTAQHNPAEGKHPIGTILEWVLKFARFNQHAIVAGKDT